mgnify:CR=1 FL=1
MDRTISQNHLSELANKGRYGDTEIAVSKHVDPGKKWHVSKFEKSLMDRGSGGERIVDSIGSGTYNPETGLEEKWIQAALMAGQVGLTLADAWKSYQIKKETYEDTADVAQEGIDATYKAGKQLYERTGAGLQSLREGVGRNLESLSTEQGLFKDKARDEEGQTLKKQGFAFSGAVKEKFSDIMGTARDKYESTVEDMISGYQLSQGEITGDFLAEKERLRTERSRLERERDLASENAERGFFGF